MLKKIYNSYNIRNYCIPMKQFSRNSIVAFVISASETRDERRPGSATLATLPPKFFLLHEGAYQGFGKYKCLRERVPAQTFKFEIELFGKAYPTSLVSPGPVYRANFEWESFFGVRSKKQFETNKVGDQVLALFPNTPTQFDTHEIVCKLWKKMYGDALMQPSDYPELHEEAIRELTLMVTSILFKGKDLTGVVTPEEARQVLAWCLVSGLLSLNQHKKLFKLFVKHRLVPAGEPITGYICKNMRQALTPEQSALVNDMRNVVLDLVNSVLNPVLPVPLVPLEPLVPLVPLVPLYVRRSSRCSLL